MRNRLSYSLNQADTFARQRKRGFLKRGSLSSAATSQPMKQLWKNWSG